MSAATCFYHPGQVASTACAQCSAPLCAACTETVAGKSVCRRCVAAIRARVASQINPTAPSPGSVAVAPVTGVSATGLLLGGVYGALIGIAGAFVLAKIEFYTNFQIGLLNSLVGFGVGFGVLLGCKRGGLAPAVMGGVLAFFAMMLSEYFYFGDEAVPGVTFVDHLSHMTMGWLFVAIGVYGGANTPLRAGR